MATITVIGAGSFGTVLANILSAKGHHVTLWGKRQAVVDDINQNNRNSRYLAEAVLTSRLKATTDLEEALQNTEIILWAVPTQSIRSVWENHRKIIPTNGLHVNVAKGIEVRSGKRISELFAEFDIAAERYVLLAGPSHAEEIALEKATTLVSISASEAERQIIQTLFTTNHLRVYTNADLVGSELAGAFKNVVAITAGISDGFGLGDNSKAALITRSLMELGRLVSTYGGSVETLFGLTGVGDLIATCTSAHSRNRHVGEQLGRGRSLTDILEEMVMVAEGVDTCKAFYQLKGELDMPIVDVTYRVMFENQPVRDMIFQLMTRDQKDEF